MYINRGKRFDDMQNLMMFHVKQDKSFPVYRYHLQRVFPTDKSNIKINMKIDPDTGKTGSDISFRKRLLNTSRGYADKTTIHGIYYLFYSNRLIERHIWFLVVVAAMMFTIFQTSNLYTHWQNEPVIITLDSIAMPIKEIRFPAVTICPQGAITSALDAVLFKQLKEFIGNKTIVTSQKTKRSAPDNDELKITEELLRKFLKEKYPGVKKKPTKIVKVMMSDDPELAIENEAVLLPGLDFEECGNSSIDDYILAVKEMKKGTCPDGLSMFKDLFCYKMATEPMDYNEAGEYCNSQSRSSLPSLESKIDLETLQELIKVVKDDAEEEFEGVNAGNIDKYGTKS